MVLTTEEDYKQFKRLYDNALSKSKDVFIWNGHQVLTMYAKYVLEYYELKNPK